MQKNLKLEENFNRLNNKGNTFGVKIIEKRSLYKTLAETQRQAV